MVAASSAEVIQLVVGAVLGTTVSLNLSRFGLSLMDPKTRWKALGVIVLFLFSFLAVTELIISAAA